MSYFPPYNNSKNKIDVELDLSFLCDLKNAAGKLIQKDVVKMFAKKDKLAHLKSEFHQLDIDKLAKSDDLKLPPTDLSQLSDVVKNEVVKKKDYNAKIKYIEDKILSVTKLATTFTFNAKINEVKGKILSITNLTTTAALSTADHIIPNITDLVIKADYDAEMKDIKNKYFVT